MWYHIVVQNGVGCRVLFMLTRYFRMTNYMWMFCEGFYLHRLISAAFAEQKSFVVFYLLGWGKYAIFYIIFHVCLFVCFRRGTFLQKKNLLDNGMYSFLFLLKLNYVEN